MSVSKRKIGYYSLSFVHPETNEILNGDGLYDYFKKLLNEIDEKTFEEKKITVTTSNKFYYMADFFGTEYINIRLEAVKVGHRPYLVDEETGNKRDNPKGLHEGEAEISHLSAKLNDDEIVVVLEERKVGVTIKQIAVYFNKFIQQSSFDVQYKVNYAFIPYEDFLQTLKSLRRLLVGHIILDREHLGSEFLNMIHLKDPSIRDPIELSFKPTIRQTIEKNVIESLYNITGNGKKINRIRVEGVSYDDSNIKLDTDSLKLIKHINVTVNEDTGIVDSEDMFNNLNTTLKDI